MDSHQRDNLIDAVLLSALFFILSHEDTLQLAKQIPISNPRITNSIVFAISFIGIQRITNRI